MYCPSCGTQAMASARFCTQCGSSLSEVTSPQPGTETKTVTLASAARSANELSRPYAGFWHRTAAAAIDCLVLVLAGVWVVEPIYPEAFGAKAALIVWPSVALYFSVFEMSPLQATPGKLVMRIKVTNLRAERVGMLRAFGRTLAKLLSLATFGFGFLLAGVSARRQALHDIVTRSLVVSIKQQPAESTLPYGTSMPFSRALAWFVIVVAVCVFFTVGNALREDPKSFQDLVMDIRAGGSDDPKVVGRSFKLPKREKPTQRASQ